jgi:hypothetical protein
MRGSAAPAPAGRGGTAAHVVLAPIASACRRVAAAATSASPNGRPPWLRNNPSDPQYARSVNR